jgi:hypothetical protein
MIMILFPDVCNGRNNFSGQIHVNKRTNNARHNNRRFLDVRVRISVEFFFFLNFSENYKKI